MHDYRNVWLYWRGPQYKAIEILRNIIYLHSTNGNGYQVHLVTRENLHDYLEHIPECFDELNVAHQADYVRVNVVLKYGGIWLDSDTLVLESLDSMFEFLEKRSGFFITEDRNYLFNGVFGSKKGTPIMNKWAERINNVLSIKRHKLNWTDIGNTIITDFYLKDKGLYQDYEILEGRDSVYPVIWHECVNEMIDKPYENYKSIVRRFQPLLIFTHQVYQKLEGFANLFDLNIPLNYFINLSFNNMKHLKHYNFIEIGTSNFDTLLTNDTQETGISIEPIKYYLDCLSNNPNVEKMNVAISDHRGSIDVYYIPEKIIDEKKLPHWFKRCNSVNTYHNQHIKHNFQNIVQIDKVQVLPLFDVYWMKKIKSLDYLKIDTEGHDVVILKSFYQSLKVLPKCFRPKKIFFESNEITPDIEVNEIIALFRELSYKCVSRGYDTTLQLM